MAQAGCHVAQSPWWAKSVSSLQSEFDEFVEAISLGQKQWERVDSAYKGLQEHLAQAYNIPPEYIFIQGSCANGTAVKPPPEGEYDLDVVVIIPDGDVSSNSALEKLERILASSSRYEGKLERKKPCVRIRYADEEIGGFHIDVVPARVGIQQDAPLEAPGRDDGWRGTAPVEYTEWCRSKGEPFSRTVKAMKRWRDEQQDVRQAVKSIVLQVLVAECMPAIDADDLRLSGTLTMLQTRLASTPGPPAVPNPVLPSENLTSNWTQESFNSFRQEIASAQTAAKRAVELADDQEAAATWRELLGEDFPLPDASTEGIVIADASHAKLPSARGWTEQLDSRFTIQISGRVVAEDRRRLIFRRYPPGRLLMAGWRIEFRADVQAPDPVTTWWQVVNTGGHARSVGGLRGDFFKAKTLGGAESPDERVNWEDTSYTGSHWIEAFLVRNNVVVGRSGPLYVSVRNPRYQFRR
jgi:hypothetical protein